MGDTEDKGSCESSCLFCSGKAVDFQRKIWSEGCGFLEKNLNWRLRFPKISFVESGGSMEKELRIWIKAFLIIAGMLLFCFLAGKHGGESDQEKAERIRGYEADPEIEKTQTVLLAYGEQLFLQGDAEEKSVFTASGSYTYETDEVEDALYQQVTAYIRDGVILDIVIKEKQTQTTVSNVWVSEVEKNRILCFLNGVHFYLPVMVDKENREQVADLFFENGMIADCRFKKEKISGKLLGVSEGQILVGEKQWELTEDVRVYRLYGKLEEAALEDLQIGCQNADYVIEKEKICACLITSEENMENIRVLIQGDSYSGNYHESVLVTADCDYLLSWGEQQELYQADTQLVLTPDSSCYKNNDRVHLTMTVNSGRLELQSIKRSREKADYRGSMEIIKTDRGLVVINELLLEEYLYGVVPSEMPASYPEESLKAQAVCARTYAYGNMEKAGLPEFGAHVDDSTAFQVYGNVEECVETTEAVKNTKGLVLMYQDMPIHAYYYSTSCGMGTDLRAWNGLEAETLPYLQAKVLKGETGWEEQEFAEFIRNEQKGFWESNEPWFRWHYQVGRVDIEEMEQRIMERYALQPGFILTKTENDYISQQPKGIGELKDLQIIRRGEGGIGAELLIEGTKGTYLIQTEYNIRYVLKNGENKVIRQDGSETEVTAILPSAFLTIVKKEKDGMVTGYFVYGGGYGHGIGMSQNGAKNMALAGIDAEEILDFFYEQSEMELLY